MQIKFSQQNLGLLSIIQQLGLGDAAGKAEQGQLSLPTPLEKAGWESSIGQYLLPLGCGHFSGDGERDCGKNQHELLS